MFCINTNGSGYKDLLDFNGTSGKNPYGGLTLGGSKFYGLTAGGGVNGAGNVFSIPVSGGSPTTLYSFPMVNAANFPQGNLILSGTTLYGTTNADGPPGGGYGSVFSLPVSGGTPTTF